MRKFKFAGLRFVFWGILGGTILGFAISALWNALMPFIFGLPAINFWQALGLFLLSRLLFGRGGHGFSRRHKSRFVRGWKNLTPDQRQRFRSAMEARGPGTFGNEEAAEKA